MKPPNKKFLIVLSNDDFTDVKLVPPGKETDDNDEALGIEVKSKFSFRSIRDAFAFVHANNIELTGEFIGCIY